MLPEKSTTKPKKLWMKFLSAVIWLKFQATLENVNNCYNIVLTHRVALISNAIKILSRSAIVPSCTLILKITILECSHAFWLIETTIYFWKTFHSMFAYDLLFLFNHSDNIVIFSTCGINNDNTRRRTWKYSQS